MEFDQMIDEIDLVIGYEKRRKERHVWGNNGSEKGEQMCIEIDDEGKQGGQSSIDHGVVQHLQFLQVRDSLLNFKVVYQDGTFKYMNNRQLRKIHPDELFDFYEANFDLQFN